MPWEGCPRTRRCLSSPMAKPGAGDNHLVTLPNNYGGLRSGQRGYRQGCRLFSRAQAALSWVSPSPTHTRTPLQPQGLHNVPQSASTPQTPTYPIPSTKCRKHPLYHRHSYVCASQTHLHPHTHTQSPYVNPHTPMTPTEAHIPHSHSPHTKPPHPFGDPRAYTLIPTYTHLPQDPSLLSPHPQTDTHIPHTQAHTHYTHIHCFDKIQSFQAHLPQWPLASYLRFLVTYLGF